MVRSFELLMDLILSFLGYGVLIYVLSLPVVTIVWVFFQPSWTLHENAIFLAWRDDVTRWIVLSLWVARFVLRWRRHLACAWGYLTGILRWLSPLSPKPYGICQSCRTATHGELGSGGEQEDDVCVKQRGTGIFL